MDVVGSGSSARRATGHELVPHIWAPDEPRSAVMAVTGVLGSKATASAEMHRFAERIGEFDEPAWVRYDPWAWMMQVEYARGEVFASPLAWPE